MIKTELYPLLFYPIYKPYIWGGKNLRKIGKVIGDNQIVAESWEISDHGEDISVVKNGFLTGKNLHELVETYGEDISPTTKNNRFPVIIKYIDANKRLSVQVHPDDNYAMKHENPTEMGKTECWYIMDAPPDAELIMGIKKGVSREDFISMIRENRIEDGLNRLRVKKGDVIFIKTGTVHALLEGIMVCEIQQNSDTTYRLYDWGRVGSDGKSRPLHIKKAIEVINFPKPEKYENYMKDIFINYDQSIDLKPHQLIRCQFFNIDFLNLISPVELNMENHHFEILNIIEGKGKIIYKKGEQPYQLGDTILIPRTIQVYKIETSETKALRTFL